MPLCEVMIYLLISHVLNLQCKKIDIKHEETNCMLSKNMLVIDAKPVYARSTMLYADANVAGENA